jgi:UDP-N-acetylmuramoyl-tripeptide--D-alanyl-D-alanine ligase
MAVFTFDEITSILSCAHVQQQGRWRVFKNITIDSRSVKPGSLFIAIRGVNLDGHAFISDAVAQGARCLIVGKKLRTAIPKEICVIRVEDTTRALGQLARAHRLRFSIPVIAVTGSAGKTTTKDMIAGVLKQKFNVLKNQGSFNNHWGVPLTLLQLSDRHEAAVVEAGTNHPGEIAYLAKMICPTIVVLTNIGASHLEGFHSVENVYREKRVLVDALTEKGIAVFNDDDPFLRRLNRMNRSHLSFGIKAGADITAEEICLDQKARLCFRINGRYPVTMYTPVRENVFNALAAVACARILKMPFADICAGLNGLRLDNHNRQHIERVKGVTVINDSYNANPVSFRSSLNTLKYFPSRGRKFLVCGDMLELGKDAVKLHREMGMLAADSAIDRIWAFGSLMEHFVQAAAGAKTAKHVMHYRKIALLNRSLIKDIRPGDVVLVKGSRGMRMERVVEFLKKHLAEF